MKTAIRVMRGEADGSVTGRICQEEMRAHLSTAINNRQAASSHLPPGLVQLDAFRCAVKPHSLEGSEWFSKLGQLLGRVRGKPAVIGR